MKKRRAFLQLLSILPFYSFSTEKTQVKKSQTVKSLRLFDIHTNNKIHVEYYKNGKYDRSALRELNRFLKDRNTGESKIMDINLFNHLSDIQRNFNNKEIVVFSGYRSQETQNELRKADPTNVAKVSMHSKGQAIDFHISGVSEKKLALYCRRKRMGGVGLYNKSGFIHLDTGKVRNWNV